MGYKIRYGPEKTPRRSSFLIRAAVSAGILAGTAAVRWLRPEAGNALGALFQEAPVTALEQATAACAAAVTGGKGWGYGLTVFASMLLS